MKNSLEPFFFFLIVLLSLNPIIKLEASEQPLIYADAAIIVDANTGSIVFDYNASEQLGIASITKLMTVSVFLDEAKEQDIKLTDVVPLSNRAANLTASNTAISGVIFSPGQSLTVEELLELSLIYSDNGAAIQLAELASGSEQEHVDKMNAKAKEWGMNDTQFYNVTGLTNYDYEDYIIPNADPNAYNVSTAADIAKMDYNILHTHPEIVNITSKPSMSLSFLSDPLRSYNLMLPGGIHEYEGVLGLKTGHSGEAKYCFTSYYMDEESSYYTVILGADTVDDRFYETSKLLDYAKTLNLQVALSSENSYDIDIPGSQRSSNVLYPINDLMMTADQSIQVQLAELEYNEEYFEDGYLVKNVPPGESPVTAKFDILNGESIGFIFDDSNSLNIPLITKNEIKRQNLFERSIVHVYNFFVDFGKQVL